MTVDHLEVAGTHPAKGPFFVIKHSYIGPNPNDPENIMQERWDIRDEPGQTNVSLEPKIEGWLGSSGDWSSDAYGEFATIGDARAYIAKRVGHLVPMEEDEDDLDEGVVEAYRAHIETIVIDVEGWWGSCDAFYFGLTAETTDEEIAEIASEEMDNARREIEDNEGGIPAFDGDLEAFIIGLRDDLREEDEDD